MAKDITLKDKNGGIKYPKTVTAIVYENGTGKTLQTIIEEMRQVDAATNTRTQHFKADVNNLDTLKNKTDIGLYNYVGNGWRGAVSINYDSTDNVSQVALSSSTPSYNGNTLTWIPAQPCAMARTYTNGAWSHWEKVGAPVVNDLTTGGTDKALSAEMGKTLKEGLDALGPKISERAKVSPDGVGDLDVADSYGFVILRLRNGHIITQNFNSEDIAFALGADNVADLDLGDEDGNVVARFKNGHIITQNFNSSNVYTKQEVDNKTAGGFLPYQRVTRFKVEVDCNITIPQGYNAAVGINTTPPTKLVYEDNAVLYLPASYTQSGTPTKLIIYCKHGASEVSPSSDPIMGTLDRNVFHYLISLGYAVMSADGVPDAYASVIGICERVVGNYISVQSAKRVYDYVIKNYNIDRNGAYVYGYSQGGHYANNVIDLSGIPIIAATLVSPVLSFRYHQWDLSASGTIGGVSWTRLARLNVARLFGFPSVSNDTELLALQYDQSKVQGYDPWTRNVENPYDSFVQNGNLWGLPDGFDYSTLVMKKHLRCPYKIWAATNDNVLGADVMRVFVQAAKNAGCVCDMRLYSSGSHSIQSSQSSIGTFTDNGETCNLYPLAYEIALWLQLNGGYNVITNN